MGDSDDYYDSGAFLDDEDGARRDASPPPRKSNRRVAAKSCLVFLGLTILAAIGTVLVLR